MKNHPSLYSKIFVRKFDDRPAVRRLGETCKYARNRTKELVKRFLALKRFKFMPCRLFSAAPTARDDIWLAYLMFLENDQRNYQQLVHYAHVDKFASSFVKQGGPFHDGMDRNAGWKVDNQVNALVAWLFWFTDKGGVHTLSVLLYLRTLIDSFRKNGMRDSSGSAACPSSLCSYVRGIVQGTNLSFFIHTPYLPFISMPLPMPQ